MDGIFINQYLPWFFIIGLVFVSLNLLSTVILLFNNTNNKSPGAVDNASGVSVVFELLKYYSNDNFSLKNHNICRLNRIMTLVSG